MAPSSAATLGMLPTTASTISKKTCSSKAVTEEGSAFCVADKWTPRAGRALRPFSETKQDKAENAARGWKSPKVRQALD